MSSICDDLWYASISPEGYVLILAGLPSLFVEALSCEAIQPSCIPTEPYLLDTHVISLDINSANVDSDIGISTKRPEARATVRIQPALRSFVVGPL